MLARHIRLSDRGPGAMACESAALPEASAFKLMVLMPEIALISP
ncbi:MAG: hypothetical protein AAGD09_10065 [Cyanobacteria bacterium P01_F01_bin.56]